MAARAALPRADVRAEADAGIPAPQAGLRPRQPHEPRQHRRLAGDHREPALRRVVTRRGSRRRCSISRGRGGFAAAVEMCNGVGVCRKKLEGTMCPSYMATKDEEHSTRGAPTRCGAVLSGRLPPGEFTGTRLYEVMACASKCKAARPSARPTWTWPSSSTNSCTTTTGANGLPLRNRLFGRHRAVERPRARTPRLANAINGLPPVRWLLEKTVGIDRRRPLPALPRRRSRTGSAAAHAGDGAAWRGRAVPRYVLTYNTPEIGFRRREAARGRRLPRRASWTASAAAGR